MSVGLVLGVFFVRLFGFSILCVVLFSLDYFVLFLQYYAKRLLGKNVSEMTILCRVGRKNLTQSISQLYSAKHKVTKRNKTYDDDLQNEDQILRLYDNI